ncbi:MAG: CRISPR-associated endonuclease Cas2 [Deltaproteobacteria bacterium]|nr:CRISPR-associated endonuclease Cas2 [Deltaproteobacteria bacterium]
MNMIVAYDIADPRRLNKVAKVAKDYGIRVQKSIFEVDVDGRRFAEMKARVEEVIEASEDGVKYFPLCEKCARTMEIIGQGVFVDPDEEYYVL